MQVQYIGGASQRVLSNADMAAMGHEDHEGLWFGPAPEEDPFQPLVLEVSEDVAETLTTKLKNEFRLVVEEEPEPEEPNRDDLIDEAKSLGVKGATKLTDEDLVAAIAEKKAEGESSSDDDPKGDPAS